MTAKQKLDILEKIFAREIYGHIWQTKSKSQINLVKILIEEGLVKEVEYTLQGPLPITVNGYVLTILGNLYYCTSCI